MSNSKKKVFIAVPCGTYCETETMKSIYELSIPENVTTYLSFLSGYSVSDARNKLASDSINGNYDYTFFVDSDIILPANILDRLIFLDTDIASGWYPKKQSGDVMPEIHRLNENENKYDVITEFLEYETPRVIGVDGAGFGCVLVKNSVFEKVRLCDGRYFEYVYYQNGTVLSEDLSFCSRAKNAGCTILVDTSLRCGHIGKIYY